ncbi:MAG TPA: helix-turn-helix transcriptional regulator [Nitrospira sp.]|nr:helix-turn-helix transcriptional regulator [Nitrospira sp.]
MSRRETQILGWIAQGKSNPEIGVILCIGRRTVDKHLERTYGRLGVENHHATLTVALEAARRR